MMSFRGGRLAGFALPTSSVWLLTDIAEAKGRQELFTRQSPQILRALREQAMIQSVESSNRIEGVTVEPSRLRPLVLGNTRPRDRSEREIQGYRDALKLIHVQAEELSLAPAVWQRLHQMIQADSGDAGQWKRVESDIVEFRPGAPPQVRFRTVAAKEVAAAVAELDLTFRDSLNQGKVQPLVALAGLILDFLCIHPFRDGNGRVSRSLTLLGLYQQGYEVGRYISLERLIEDSREDYYEVLRRSSENWHQGRHDILPWLNYFLTVVRRAYRLFEERAGQIKGPRGGKARLVEDALANLVRDFTLTDLERACPGVSRDWIRRVLRNLQKTDKVVCLGKGPGALWRNKGTTLK